jgi:putative transposase
MEAQGGLSIVRMCEMTGVSRASYYRHWEESAPTAAEMAVRDAIQRVAVAHRFYGYRRVTVVVQREGFAVGAKKVRRLMRRITCWRCGGASSWPPRMQRTAMWCIPI